MKKKDIKFWGILGLWFVACLADVLLGPVGIKAFAMLGMIILFIVSLISATT